MASSLASGLLIQHITTCITCLVLGFLRSWALTLVIMSVVPVIVILQIISQRVAGPLLAVERAQFGLAATLVERAVSDRFFSSPLDAPAASTHSASTCQFVYATRALVITSSFIW